MPLTSKFALTTIAALALTACGSSTVTTIIDNTPSFTRDIQTYNAAAATARTAPVSDAASVAGASGVYTGKALVSVLGSGTTRNFLGDATLSANIGGGTVSGTLSGFTDGTSPSAPEAASGTLIVTGQTIGATTASRFVSGVSGQLSSASNTVILGAGGTLNGDFRNTPTDSLYASGAVNGSTLNGVPGRAAVINVYGNK